MPKILSLWSPGGIKIGLSVVLLCTTSGCSINRHGFVQFDSVQSETAEITIMRAPGTHLAINPGRTSLTLGWLRRIQMRALSCPGLASQPLVDLTRFYGIQFVVGTKETGITVGMRETSRFLFPSLKDDDLSRRLILDTQNLDAAFVDLGDFKC